MRFINLIVVHCSATRCDRCYTEHDLTTDHEVTFHKVAGHADNELNNRCDELARAAICSLRGSASAEKPKE